MKSYIALKNKTRMEEDQTNRRFSIHCSVGFEGKNPVGS